MKKIRFILCFILFAIGILFQGEAFGEYIQYFTLPIDGINFKFEDMAKKVDTDTTKEFLMSKSKETGVKIFAVSFLSDEVGERTVEFYINDDETKTVLTDEYYVVPGEYKSILYDNTKVEFKKFSEIKQLESIEQICILGKTENIGKFTGECFDNIDCVFHAGTPGVSDELIGINIVWCIVVILNLLLTLYDISINKKEYAVRMSCGEHAVKLIAQNTFIDIFTYVFEYAVLLRMLRNLTNVQFVWRISFTLICVLCVVNTFMYFQLFFTNIKNSMYGDPVSSHLVRTSYVVKLVCTVMSIVVFSSNFGTVIECVNFYRQKSYFDAYKNYDYIKLYYNNVYENDSRDYNALNMDMYRNLFNDGRVMIQRDISGTFSENMGARILYFNRNTIGYLKSEFKEIDFDDLKSEKIYAFIPKKWSRSLSEEEWLSLKQTVEWQIYGLDSSDLEFEQIIYSDSVSLIAMSNSYQHDSQLVKNPIVFYSNIDETKQLGKKIGDVNILLGESHIMYDLNDRQFNSYLLSTDFDKQADQIVKRNIYDVYKENTVEVRSYMYLNLAMSLITLCLEILLIITVVKYEYMNRSRELAIKTTLGYSRLSKYKTVWVLCACTFVFGLAGSVIISRFINEISAKYLLFGTFIAFAIDLMTNIYYIDRVEKEQLSKLIKGGSL